MPAEASQLWSKDLPLDALIHRFTVGSDPTTDLQLVPFDCLGSAAHARTDCSVAVLRRHSRATTQSEQHHNSNRTNSTSSHRIHHLTFSMFNIDLMHSRPPDGGRLTNFQPTIFRR